MREFDHPHILTLIGIALDKEGDMPLVILPYMRHGDLLSYIRDETNVSYSSLLPPSLLSSPLPHTDMDSPGQRGGHATSHITIHATWRSTILYQG